MRVRVDRSGEAVHLELTGTAPARRAEVADGVALTYDAAGRVVGVELRGVAPEALHEFTVSLSGVAEAPATMSPAAPASGLTAAPARPAAPAAYLGPVTWDAEAEAAVAQIPFFRRGPTRLAAIALARQRGVDRVSVEILREAVR